MRRKISVSVSPPPFLLGWWHLVCFMRRKEKEKGGKSE